MLPYKYTEPIFVDDADNDDISNEPDVEMVVVVTTVPCTVLVELEAAVVFSNEKFKHREVHQT